MNENGSVKRLRHSSPEWYGPVSYLIFAALWAAIRSSAPDTVLPDARLYKLLIAGLVCSCIALVINHAWWLRHRHEISVNLRKDSLLEWGFTLGHLISMSGFYIAALATLRNLPAKFPDSMELVALPFGLFAAIFAAMHYNWHRQLSRDTHFIRQTTEGLHAP